MARSIEQHGRHVTCALIGTSRKIAAYSYTSCPALWATLEYELVDANGGMQKVRVEPATRSAVATCNLNNVNNVNNLTAHRKGLRRFWLHPRDRYHAVAQTYNNCAETHLGGGVMSPFVSPLSAIARVHDPTVIGSVALRKGPWKFCPHCIDRCHALMFTCRNSPLWQCCERCNNVLFSFWLPWLARTWSIEQCSHDAAGTLIGTSRKLAAYNYTSSLTLWMMLEYKLVDANRVCQGIQNVRV